MSDRLYVYRQWWWWCKGDIVFTVLTWTWIEAVRRHPQIKKIVFTTTWQREFYERPDIRNARIYQQLSPRTCHLLVRRHSSGFFLQWCQRVPSPGPVPANTLYLMENQQSPCDTPGPVQTLEPVNNNNMKVQMDHTTQQNLLRTCSSSTEPQSLGSCSCSTAALTKKQQPESESLRRQCS